MGYIKELRKLVGKRPLLVCACGCLIYDELGRVLLERRADDGLWGNPGGCMELGEEPEETVIRKIFEETGLNVSKLELFGIYSGEEQHHIFPNGDEVYYVNIMFETTSYSGVLKDPDEESLEFKFFHIKDIPKDLSKPFISIARDLNNKF